MIISSISTLYSAFTLFAIVAISAFAAPTLALANGASFRPLSETTIRVGQVAAQGEHGAAVRDTALVSAKRPRRLVIMFHGIRGRGSVMDRIATSWQSTLPDTGFVSPDAPFSHRSGGHQWFVVDDQVLRPDRVQAARKAFDDLVSDIVRREGFADALDRVAFVGVSQGAIMALDAVATGRWKVGALVSFAGLLPLPPTSSSTDTPILLMHGGADRTIPSAASVAAERQLQSAGYDVTLRTFPDVGHTISTEEAREASLFLRERLD